MNYEEALNYINDKNKFGSRLGLETISKLLDLLGNPQDDLKHIHVGGTNGKGSTSSFLVSMLNEAGYKVGLFTSPFLERFNERISVNNKDIEDHRLAEITKEIKDKIEIMLEEGYEHPTTFEIVTAIAFVYFKEEEVDYVVLEVGLGGKEDSTNVIKDPKAVVLTTIDYDHIDILGNSLEEIAYQKAGIIKNNSLVISYPQQAEAEEVIKKVARERNSSLKEVPLENIDVLEISNKGSVYNYHYKNERFENINIKLLGDYQIYNSVVALTTILELRKSGEIKISDEEIIDGLKKTKWAGRLEIINDNPLFLIDGAHNLQGAENLKKNLKHFDYNRLILGFSILGDKDYTKIIEILAPLADEIVLTKINMPRMIGMDTLEEEVSKYNEKISVEEDISKAIEKTIDLYEEGDLIVFAGSLYLIGEVRTIVNDYYKSI